MKILRHEVLLNTLRSGFIDGILNEINSAIETVVWPQDNNQFSMKPTPKGNGVKPIKNNCMSHLQRIGWELEHRLQLSLDLRPGPLDATKAIPGNKYFALEWETGNISSSHRAVNKMILGMLERALIGGVLILPSRSMYTYLTDRIGNFQELSPYFPIYRRFNIGEGYLAIIEIEHDELDTNVPLIPKGTDGMARFQKTRR